MDGAAPAKALASASMEASAMTDASQASAVTGPALIRCDYSYLGNQSIR